MVDARRDIERILEACRRDMETFCRVLLPDYFDRPFCEEHRKLFRVLDDPTRQRVVVTAPRGFGKTTLITLGYVMRAILFLDVKFVVVIEASQENAILVTENLKKELVRNEMVAKLFGRMESSAFSKEMWVTSTGVAVMPRGAGQLVRGVNFEGHRPGLIILDDVEEPKKVRSEALREQLWRWFNTDVVMAVDKPRRDWRIIVIGTPLHQDGLIARLMEDPEWESVRLELFDDRYRSTWPEFMSDEMVQRTVEAYRQRGLLDELLMEYRGLMVTTETSAFRPEYFRRYREGDLDLDNRWGFETVVLVDPAKTVTARAADTAIVAVGIDRERGHLYVRDIVHGKMYPDRVIGEALGMVERFGAVALGIESTSLNEWVMYPLRNEMLKRGLAVEIVDLKAGGVDKEKRVEALIPYYKRGMVWHNAAVAAPLEEQLLAFPRPRKWDVMDAFAYIVQMLERGGRYIDTPFGEVEFELEYEPPLEDWRCL